MTDIIFGVPAIALTIIAYYQTDRLRFLKINVFAVFFFGMTLLVKNGVTGAMVSFMSVAVYIAAIFLGDEIRKKLSYILPLLAFAISFQSYETNIAELAIKRELLVVLPYLPSVAAFLVTLSALQSRIVTNKLLLMIALFIWASYSFLLMAWFAFAADIIGIFVLVLSLRKIQSQRACMPH